MKITLVVFKLTDKIKDLEPKKTTRFWVQDLETSGFDEMTPKVLSLNIPQFIPRDKSFISFPEQKS